MQAIRRLISMATGFLEAIGQEFHRSLGSAVPKRTLSWSSHQHWNRVPERLAGTVWTMDKPLIVILIAIAGTLLLFAAGVFPYPFGLIVLILMAFGRLLQIKWPA